MVDRKEKIINIIENYRISTTIDCEAYDTDGELLSEENNECDYCQTIKKIDNNREECRKSYIYGGYEAEKWGEPYIYFCPFGLVNWAVPVLENNNLKYILTGGPVLMQQAKEFIIKDVVHENTISEIGLDESRELLKKIKVINPNRVQHLASLLMSLAENIMEAHDRSFKQKKQLNSINAEVAETIHELKKAEKAYNTSETVYPFEKENELISKVKLGDKKEAQKLLNEILGIIYFQSGDDFEIVKAKAIELIVVLARASIEIGADLEVIFGLEYIYLQEINNVQNINELSEILAKVLDRFFESAFTIKNVRNKDIIFKAMNYIRENYNKTDINLDKVASRIGLNSSYFSKLFKEEVGMSYSDYLNKVRIEASKDLLNKDLSLAEIAQEVGFNDQSYFSKVFKKFESISPGKWRKGFRNNSK